MALQSKRESRLWLATGLCIFLIYSSLYLARPVAEYLRERNLLRLAVLLVFLLAAALVVWRLLVTDSNWRVLVTVGVIAAGYLALLTAVPMMPEERLHFLEYGVVAALIYQALRERQLHSDPALSGRTDPLLWLSPFTTAIVLTGIVGWVDEGIQAVLPNRVYDLRDVAFNTAAAIICLVAIKLVERARGTNRPPAQP